MSNNMYILYLKRISEGDSGIQGTAILSQQFKKLVNGASTSVSSAMKCFKYLENLGIEGIKSFYNFLKKLFASAKDRFKGIFDKVWSSISKAIQWASNLLKRANITKTTENSYNMREDLEGTFSSIYQTSRKIGRERASDNYYDQILAFMWAVCRVLAVVAVSVILVILSLWDAIFKTHSADYANNALKDLKNKLKNESTVVFKKLTRIIETYQLSEGLEIQNFIDTYIQKAQPKAMELWGKVDAAAKSNKVLAITISICAACVFGYMGVRKYLVSHKQKGAATA